MLAKLEHPHVSKNEYDSRLSNLQLDLMTLQHGLFQQRRRCVIVFEGIDASGKGGAIRRLTANMDPRGYQVHPIGPPTPDEHREHYLQRFWRKLPRKGNTAIFDRSWYGRVLVERVEALAEEDVWQRAYDEINDFEKMLIDDGLILIKVFLYIDKDEQKNRFRDRLEKEHKRWKLTPDDINTRLKWDAYVKAFEDMLATTSPKGAPWHIVAANSKKHARLSVLGHVKKCLEQEIDCDKVNLLSPELEQLAKQFL